VKFKTCKDCGIGNDVAEWKTSAGTRCMACWTAEQRKQGKKSAVIATERRKVYNASPEGLQEKAENLKTRAAKSAKTQEAHRVRHLDARRAKSKAWYAIPENKERRLAQQRTEEGKAAACIAVRKYQTKRLKTDPVYFSSMRIRSCIRSAIVGAGYRKNSRSAQILGAEFGVVLQHLCDSIGTDAFDGIPDGYHVDHIYPMALAQTEEESLRLNHYTNLQLLTSDENFTKSDTIPGTPFRARDMSSWQKTQVMLSLPEIR
jgi:hypothetical protein